MAHCFFFSFLLHLCRYTARSQFTVMMIRTFGCWPSDFIAGTLSLSLDRDGDKVAKCRFVFFLPFFLFASKETGRERVEATPNL